VLTRSPRRALVTVAVVAAGLATWFVVPGANAGPNHATLVAAAPSTLTPNISDGDVDAIYDAGTTVLVGGTFTAVRNRGYDTDIPRRYLLSFDKATGVVESGFSPAVNGEITTIVAGPTAGTAYIAGTFSTVNGVTRKKLALINTSTGALVTSFVTPAFNGKIMDLVRVGSRLLVGGVFTNLGSANPRGGLASLNATTGTLDSYLTVKLTGHHNWTSTNGAAYAPVGVENMAVSPDGTQLVVIGNFRYANGVLHDQAVKLTLGATSATVAAWSTDRYTPRCAYRSFDSYVRDVAFSPDGTYFVIAATGAPNTGTLCDAAARWSATATGTALQPTWIAYTGGDTLLSVAVSEKAVYVGGHMRWMNNSLGRDSAAAGAMARPSLAALDPVSGVPMAWNPGRHPRGVGVGRLYLTPAGLWIGHDQNWIGNFQYQRQKIAFLPLAGGAAPHATTTRTLPGTVYLAGGVLGQPADGMVRRSYDGAGAVGATAAVANPDGTPWSAVRGSFWVGGTLFYGYNGALYRRGFDGTTFGPANLVDPYHDSNWDDVQTGSGTDQTYRGVPTNFYAEIANTTGMMYANGRIYYTLSGQSGLFWRWFSPDSGAVGPDKFTVSGATMFGSAGGLFVSGSYLYLTNRSTGTLSRVSWNNGAPSGTPAAVGSTVDWRGRAVFVAP
jgi:hypothetical protein